MEKQKFLIGSIVYKISYMKNVEPPYVEKEKVSGVRQDKAKRKN
jgi:hypothetical protein